VQTAETFQVIREILTCWLLLKEFVAMFNRMFFYDLLIVFVRGKTDHHNIVVHFLNKTLFSCIFGSKYHRF